jgi:fructose-specific phosphotransferase system IIC component
MTPTEHNLAAVYTVVFIILAMFFLLYAIPLYAIFWKLFKKAGQPGWKFLIPYYNAYITGVIADRVTIGWVVIIVSIASQVSTYVPGTAGNSMRLITGAAYVVFYISLLIVFARKYTASISQWIVFLIFPIVGVFMMDNVKFKDSDDTAKPTPLATQQSLEQPTDSTQQS